MNSAKWLWHWSIHRRRETLQACANVLDAFYGSMGSKRLETMADYARHKYLLRIECECGRVVMSDPHKIIAACQERHITYALPVVTSRLRCTRCGRRPFRVGPGLGPC